MTEISNPEVLVVGAGLAGLGAAHLLHKAGAVVRILEAKDRCGGRIHSVYEPDLGHVVADLGPTWIWTPFQPLAKSWLDQLQLSAFPQYEEGLGIVDQGEGVEPMAYPMPGQHGSMRVVGGSQAMISRLVDLLPPGTVTTSCPVTEVEVTPTGVAVTVARDSVQVLRANYLLMAIPPRLAATLSWRPELPQPLRRALVQTPTWMAPHAKAAIVYERPFWRERGLSGRLASHTGPLVEAHDHCGPDGEPAALFGFVGWPPAVRESRGIHALEAAIEDQLLRCFGASAPRPLAIHVQDWAQCAYIAGTQDLEDPMAHPSVGPPILREPHLHGRVWFCASEMATVSPGLIEGAFSVAQHAAAALVTPTAMGR